MMASLLSVKNASRDQYTTINWPPVPANVVTRLHAGTPSAWPVPPSGSPFLSKTCQASDPPLPHFIPSAQAISVSPRELPAALGYLRPLASPGAPTGADIRPVDGLTTPKKTLPKVSHAASTPDGLSDSSCMLMVQAPIFHCATSVPRKVSPRSLE